MRLGEDAFSFTQSGSGAGGFSAGELSPLPPDLARKFVCKPHLRNRIFFPPRPFSSFSSPASSSPTPPVRVSSLLTYRLLPFYWGLALGSNLCFWSMHS